MKLIISPGFRNLKSWLNDISRLFDSQDGVIVHQGRNTIKNFTLDGIPVTIKRFKRVNLAQQIAYTFFRKTKAERAFRYASIFRQRGISTPQEIAYAEIKRHGLFTTGYFISATCPYPPAFPALVDNPGYDRQLATDLARHIAEMHRKGIVHGDLNLGNFLYHKNNSGHYDFTVIDINRSKFYNSPPPQKICAKNLRTLTHRRDLFRFMVEEYAKAMGWETKTMLEAATKELEKLESRYRRKQQIKKLIR